MLVNLNFTPNSILGAGTFQKKKILGSRREQEGEPIKHLNGKERGSLASWRALFLQFNANIYMITRMDSNTLIYYMEEIYSKKKKKKKIARSIG